jgi:hypothetical protein
MLPRSVATRKPSASTLPMQPTHALPIDAAMMMNMAATVAAQEETCGCRLTRVRVEAVGEMKKMGRAGLGRKDVTLERGRATQGQRSQPELTL